MTRSSVDEVDVWRTANVLIKEYGADAPAQAVHHASKMLEHRNYEGYAAWGLVWTAIKILLDRQIERSV